jgi:hypothetical protein
MTTGENRTRWRDQVREESLEGLGGRVNTDTRGAVITGLRFCHMTLMEKLQDDYSLLVYCSPQKKNFDRAIYAFLKLFSDMVVPTLKLTRFLSPATSSGERSFNFFFYYVTYSNLVHGTYPDFHNYLQLDSEGF